MIVICLDITRLVTSMNRSVPLIKALERVTFTPDKVIPRAACNAIINFLKGFDTAAKNGLLPHKVEQSNKMNFNPTEKFVTTAPFNDWIFRRAFSSVTKANAGIHTRITYSK